jgi:hypothetical protein
MTRKNPVSDVTSYTTMTRKNQPRDVTSYGAAGGSAKSGASPYAQGWSVQNPGMQPSRVKDVFAALERAGAVVKNASSRRLVAFAAAGVLVGWLAGVAAHQVKQSIHDDQVAARTLVSTDFRGHANPKFDAHLDAILTGSEQVIKRIDGILAAHPSVAAVCSGALPATSLIGPDVVAFSLVQENAAALRVKLQSANAYIGVLDASGGYASDSRRERIERDASRLELIGESCATEPSMSP